MKKIMYFLFLFTCFSWAQSKDVSKPCTLSSSHTTNQIDCNSYQFTATSTAGIGTTIKGYYWTFGDGSDGTGQNVTHNYSSNGTYTVILTTIGINGGNCCSNTECFTVTVNCVTDDCGSLFDFDEWAGNGDCDVILIVNTNDYTLDPGWTIISGPNAYEWHLVNQNNNIDRYEYGGPTHFSDLTDGDTGPWTITLKITLEDGDGNLCALEHTETLLSGCGGNEKVTIYPNPGTEIINIKNTETSEIPLRMEIYNHSGLKVRDILFPKGNEFSINISDLDLGLYFFKILEDDVVIKTEKFIKN
jgi:PKD repeat protein